METKDTKIYYARIVNLIIFMDARQKDVRRKTFKNGLS